MANDRPGTKIAELRKKRGYTQEQFALKLGKSVDTISNYERGKTGSDAIQLVIKMCEVLNCQPNDLLESLPVSNQPQNPGDIRSVLRDWWHRVFPTNRPLGGKEIDSIVVTLRNCVENKSNEEIASIFRPDDDLELRFKFLISDFESSQSVQYETECFSGESIHDDPDICSCIFCYLRTKNNEFLSNFGNIRLRRFVRDSSSQSGSPSYLTHALASSDLTN